MPEIGPGGMIPYGARIEASNIQNYKGPNPGAWLTALSRAVLQASIRAEDLQYLVPQVTDRITNPDGGVDASLSIELPLPSPRTAGLINSGKTIYQFKWRSKPENIFEAARGELKKLKDRDALPDYYVFVTNIDLGIHSDPSRSQHDRIKKELRNDCEEFPDNRIVVIGAAELAVRVNDDPRIRVAYFNVDLGICSLEPAMEFTERRYGNEKAPLLYNREDELSRLKRFLTDPKSKVIVVHGPPGVGKTRIVYEALSDVFEKAVYAREVPIQSAGLIQVLDEARDPAVLVVDDEHGNSDNLLRIALEAAHLKTIIIRPWRNIAHGVEELDIKPLAFTESYEFLKKGFPEFLPAHLNWLYDQFGGLPGLLLQGAIALKDTIRSDSLDSFWYKVEAILEDYEKRMTYSLSSEARAALDVLSILPRFADPSILSDDLKKICEATGIDVRQVRANTDLLKERNLIELVGHFEKYLRVNPPLLGRRIAKRAILGIADQLQDLYEKLSPEGRARLVRRVAELNEDLRDERSVQEFLRLLLYEDVLFDRIDLLAAGSTSVIALAEAIPMRTGPILRQTLEKASTKELKERLTNDNRRNIVRALEALVYRRDSYEDGAKGLLCLAEAENEKWGNNASGVFVEIFHWRNPNISKDARLRARLLCSLASNTSSRRRILVAKAAARCLESQRISWLSGGEGVQPPEFFWRPTTRGEVQEVILQLIDILKQLAADSDKGVSSESIFGLARGAYEISAMGLFEESIDALEYIETLDLNGKQRASLVTGTAIMVSELRKKMPALTDSRLRTIVQKVIERGDALFKRLTLEDFRSRFLHWLGPNPLTAQRRMLRDAKYEEISEQGERLANEAIDNPTLLTEELLDWVTDENAYNSSSFFYVLGKLDKAERWLESLENRLEKRLGVAALATYLAGWYSSDLIKAELYLDDIAVRAGKWSEAAFTATCLIGGSTKGVVRIIRCAKEGLINIIFLATQLQVPSWYKNLEIEDFLSLINGLRDGSKDVDWALLYILRLRWVNKQSEWSDLGPIALEILFNTAGESSNRNYDYYWDELAAELVKWDLEAGFKLLFAHFSVKKQGLHVFLRFHREELVQALSSRDRPRLVRTILNYALRGSEHRIMEEELPDMLDPEADSEVILQFIKEHGIEAARLVADNVDASKPGFWDLMAKLIAEWGEDEKVRSNIIHSITWIHAAYSDKAATLRPRLEPLERLLDHTDPLVKEVARQAKAALLREMKNE